MLCYEIQNHTVIIFEFTPIHIGRYIANIIQYHNIIIQYLMLSLPLHSTTFAISSLI